MVPLIVSKNTAVLELLLSYLVKEFDKIKKAIILENNHLTERYKNLKDILKCLPDYDDGN